MGTFIFYVVLFASPNLIANCVKYCIVFRTKDGQKVLSLNILHQNFCYCPYMSKTHFSCVLVWVC